MRAAAVVFVVALAASACHTEAAPDDAGVAPDDLGLTAPADAFAFPDGSTLLASTFTPAATTISTSEGAPYADCDFWIATPAQCQKTFLGYGPTRVVRLYVCLSGEVSSADCSSQPTPNGPLATALVNDFAARLAAFAGSGSRLIVRFIYNFGPTGAADAPLSIILGHLDQVAPVLLQNQDLLFALEAGFIGTWGEWHDSTNGNDTAAAQKSLLDKELAYFGGAFPTLVRYPGDLMQYAGNATPPANLGLHDDYYASDGDDGGTWNPCDNGAGYCLSGVTATELQSYAAAVATTTLFAGEFGAVDATLQSCAALDAYSYAYHPQSIAMPPYPATITSELQNEGCAAAFYNRVGTRIELQAVAIAGTPTAGGTLELALTLANTGYGRVIRARPATLVFLAHGAAVAAIPLSLAALDLRTLASTSPPTAHTFVFSVTLPASIPQGVVSVALALPDPAPSLTKLPAYALPLDSVAADGSPVFDAATGNNVFADLTIE